MASYSLGGFDAFSIILSMPRHGLWYADVELASNDASQVKGRTQLVCGALTLSGTAGPRSGVTRGFAKVRLVAGNNGLPTVAPAKGYSNAPFSVIWRDLLATAGETASPSSDAGVLAMQFGKWTGMARPVGLQLEALVRRAPTGTNWRALRDGSFWVGTETWPDSGLVQDVDYQLLVEDPHLRRLTLGVESPSLLPGTKLGGRKVSNVIHLANKHLIRTMAWVES